jgi:hypothetical protein
MRNTVLSLIKGIAVCAVLYHAFPAATQEITWSDSVLVGGTPAGGVEGIQRKPDIATDGQGTWLAVWYTTPSGDAGDGEVVCARSTDVGLTWSSPIYVNSDFDTDLAEDTHPSIAAGQDGIWIATWQRTDPDALADVETGAYVARSSDDGATWSQPTKIIDRPNDDFSSSAPAIATDGKGTWIVAGQSDDDLFRAQSTDNGESWQSAIAIETSDRGIALDNGDPAIATDKASNWRIVWSHFGKIFGSGSDRDIAFIASSDNGANWTAPALLNESLQQDTQLEADSRPDIATDGSGTWFVTWTRTDCCSDAERTPTQLQFAAEFGNSTLYSSSAQVITDLPADQQGGVFPSIAADVGSNWIIAFRSVDNIPERFGDDGDILFAASDHPGFNFAPLRALNHLAELDNDSSGQDDDVHIANDGMGNWVAVWRSNVDGGGSLTGRKIVAANTVFTGRLAGFVRDASTGVPVPCAAIRIQDNEPDLNIDRVVTTGKSGAFVLGNLAEGNYTLTLFAPGFAQAVLEQRVNKGAEVFAAFEARSESAGASISGTVTDFETAEPLVGVRVEAWINNLLVALTYTCADGRYQLAQLPAAKGVTNVDIDYLLENYDTKSEQAQIDAGQNTEVNTDMSKNVAGLASLAGTVFGSSDNQPIADARVTLTGRGNVSTTTDDVGAFAFPSLPEGHYFLTASALGFQLKQVPRAIGANDLSLIEIQLDPGSALHPADVNADGVLNAVDVQFVILVLLGTVDGDADVNGDNEEDATDLQRVINGVLGLG